MIEPQRRDRRPGRRRPAGEREIARDIEMVSPGVDTGIEEAHKLPGLGIVSRCSIALAERA